MRWKQFLTPVQSFDAEEAKKYIATHQEGTYTLLDVRQPKEYAQEHLPGSRLIPLPELADRLGELDPQTPVIVYCAVGGRSRVAAQMLSGQGFEEVYNLKGGINSWQGQKVFGLFEEEATLFKGDESPETILVLAYGLEVGLEHFYRDMLTKATDQEVLSLFGQLLEFEKQHKIQLFKRYQDYDPSISDRTAFEDTIVAETMEGGVTPEEFLEKNASVMQTVPEVLDIGMMIEAQAYDLYSRCIFKSQEPEAKRIFAELAMEEKSHLRSLGQLRDMMT
jgi:rhodanese-related sulfurtransferase/rubrerythrin